MEGDQELSAESERNEPAHAAGYVAQSWKSVAEFLRNGSVLVAVVSGGGYLLGYTTASGVADGLGVEVSDLGLEFRDLVTMSLASLLVCGLLAIVAYVITLVGEAVGGEAASDGHWRGNLLSASLLIVMVGCAMAVAWVQSSSLLPWLAATLVAVFFMSAAVSIIRSSWKTSTSLAVAMVILGVVVSGVTWATYKAAEDWAHSAVEDVRDDGSASRPPLAVGLVLSIVEGEVELDGEWHRVARIGRQVFVDCEDTWVVKDWQSFTVGPADRDLCSEPAGG